MRRFLGVGILSVLITGGAILLAQNDPQPQSASESLEAEMPQPQPQETQPEAQPPSGEETQAPEQESQKAEGKGGLPEFKEGPYTYEMPPKSLDNYYPPIGKRAKVYPAYMDTLGRRFYDLVVDLGSIHLNRDDAEVSYFLFKDYYEFVANLVPEWKDRFLLDDVVELGKELGFIKDSTDTTKTEESKKEGPKPIGKTEKVSERAMALIKKIEYSCRACHLTEIPRVYARYYWHTRDHKMNMATFMVRDPITRKKMRYRVFKRALQKDYYTILRSIDKGSRKQLRESVRRFVKRFNYNQTLCTKCHDTDPYLFTTPTIGELVSDLDKEANKRVPSKKVLRQTLASLYVQNCKGCHRVHIPTTYVQRWWYGEFDKAPEVPTPKEESKPVVSETPEENQTPPAEGEQQEGQTTPEQGGGEQK